MQGLHVELVLALQFDKAHRRTRRRLNPVENIWQYLRQNWLSKSGLRKLRRHRRRRMRSLAQTHRGSSEDHIHRNATLGPRRSVATTLGIILRNRAAASRRLLGPRKLDLQSDRRLRCRSMPIEFRRRGIERPRETINRFLAVGHRDAQRRRKRQHLNERQGAHQQPVLD